MLSEQLNSGFLCAARMASILAALLFLVFPICPRGFANTSGSLPDPSNSNTYTAPSFVKEIARLKSALETARESPERLQVLINSLPNLWTVEAGTQEYRVPTSTLADRLKKAEHFPEGRRLELDKAQEYLDALVSETDELSKTPPPNSSSAKIALDKILAQPEYHRNGAPSWWDRMRAQLNQMILDALSRIFRNIGSQKTLGQVLLWLGICAAAVLIAVAMFRRWIRSARLEEMALESAAIPARSWQQWIYASRAAADRRDYRLAIHCAYWAGISRLQDQGTVPPDHAKTPREYLRSLSKSKLIFPETHAARYQALSAMTSRLENTWYGYRTPTEEDFRDSLVQLEILGCPLT
jgi:hypothetical protein